MKKFLGGLSVISLFAVAFMAGCNTSTPSTPKPGNSAPTSTVTPTTTPTITPTNLGGFTSTPTKTRTVTPTPTITETSTSTLTSTPTNLGGFTSTPTSTQTSTPTNLGGFTSTPTITSTPAPYTTPQTTAQLPVNLGAAAQYAILAYSQVTNSLASTIYGNLGLDPGTEVDGGIAILGGGVTNVNNSAALAAEGALGTAFSDAMGRPTGATLTGGTDLGGQTLYPGVYTCGGNINLSSADLTLDAPSSSNTVFIFQVTGTNNLVIGPGRKVILSGHATANNVYWVVGGYCSLDTTSQFVGTIMTYSSVTLNTGATLNGRALVETGDVTLLGNTITDPTP